MPPPHSWGSSTLRSMYSCHSGGFQAPTRPCFPEALTIVLEPSERPWPCFCPLGPHGQPSGGPQGLRGPLLTLYCSALFQLLPLLSPESHAYSLLSQLSACLSVLEKGTAHPVACMQPWDMTVLCPVSYTAAKSLRHSPILLSSPAPWPLPAPLAGSRWALLSPSQEAEQGGGGNCGDTCA